MKSAGLLVNLLENLMTFLLIKPEWLPGSYVPDEMKLVLESTLLTLTIFRRASPGILFKASLNCHQS